MLATLLETAALVEPDRVIAHDRGQALTMSTVVDRARVGASLLLQAGARSCVFVGVTGPVLPLTLYAAATAGIPFAPVNYRSSDDVVRELISRLDDPFIIADDGWVETLGAHLSATQWLDALATTTPVETLPEVDADDIAAILFTSGTTSAPKAVPLRHGHLASYLLNTVELMGAGPDEAALVSVPPYHVAGIGSALSNTLAGRRLVYLPDFRPERWLDTVRTEGVTSAMVVPTMLARIIEHLNGAPADVPTLRQLAYGGAPIASSVLQSALESFPATGFTNAYGLTETSSTLTILTPEDHRLAVAAADPVVSARIGSVGTALPGVELQVRDENGTVLPANESGVLWVRGPQISGEYIGRERVLDEHGWFCTRDGARLDDHGYLYIEGRLDDTIIRGGENIAPAEIEDVIVAHPAVRDAAVVGLPDESWGQRTAAAVIADQLDAEEIRTWVRERLRSAKTPDDVYFVDELPYNPTGKLVRRDLADLLVGLRAGTIEGRNRNP